MRHTAVTKSYRKRGSARGSCPEADKRWGALTHVLFSAKLRWICISCNQFLWKEKEFPLAA